MTDYEIDKLAKRQAQYLAERLKSDEELLDLMFPPKYLNVEEAAQFLRVPVQTIYAKIDEIPHSKVGKRLVFKDRSLVQYIERKQNKVTSLKVIRKAQ